MDDVSTCPHCGNPEIESLLFCPRCGGDLEAPPAPSVGDGPGTAVPAEPGTAEPQQPAAGPGGQAGWVCSDPTCAAPAPPGASRCGYCDRPVVPSQGTARAAAAPPCWSLLLPDGAPFPLPEHLTLGRDPGTPLAATLAGFSNVSRHHAQLTVLEGRLLVTDLMSTNGTFLNEVRLDPNRPTPISPGDQLRLGAYARLGVHRSGTPWEEPR